MKRFILPVLIFFVFFGHGNFSSVHAFTTGGAGKMTLQPSAGLLEIGQVSSIDVLFSSGATPISSLSLRIIIPNVAGDIEVVGVNSDSSLSGWIFPVKTTQMVGTTIQVDMMALNTSLDGQAVSTLLRLGTITVKAKKPFSAKQFQFDQTVSKMFRKVDAVDILGTVGNGSFGSSGEEILPTNTATLTPTEYVQVNTPTPTQYTYEPTNTPTTIPSTGGFGSYITPTSTPMDFSYDITPTSYQMSIESTQTPTPTIIYTGETPPLYVSTSENSPPTTSEPGNKVLTISPFYQANKETKETFTVGGTAPAFSSLRINIAPDGVDATVQADDQGKWRYTLTSSLQPGDKTLTVTSDVNGETSSKTDTFKVPSKGNPWIKIGIGVWILGGLIGGFFIWKRQRNGFSSVHTESQSSEPQNITTQDSTITPASPFTAEPPAMP